MKSEKLLLLLPVALAFAVFSPVIYFAFLHWDDNFFIVDNQLLSLPFIAAAKMAFGNFFAGDYLPLSLLSLWADAQLSQGLDPHIFHTTNLLLHSINVALVWALLRKAGGTRLLCLGVAAIFAIHPLQVESVAWVSERKGLLCTAFTLLAILASTSDWHPLFKRLGYPFLFLISVLCKASNIFLPFFLLIWDLLKGSQTRKNIFLKHLPALVTSCIFVVVRMIAYSSSADHFQEVLLSPQRWLGIPLLILNALGFYLVKFISLQGFAIIYPSFVLDFSTAVNLFALAFVISLSIFYWKRTRKMEIFLALLWFFICLLPVLQIVPRFSYVNDRYAYFAIVGLAVWLAMILDFLIGLTISPLSKVKFVIPSTFLLVCICATWTREMVWQSDASLWGTTAQDVAWSGIAHLNLGGEFERNEKFSEAIEEYKKAADCDPSQGVRPQALSNIAVLYARPKNGFSNLQLAQKYLNLALAEPDDVNSKYEIRYNLAWLQYQAGKKQESTQTATGLLEDLKQRHDGRLLVIQNLTEQLLQELEKK